MKKKVGLDPIVIKIRKKTKFKSDIKLKILIIYAVKVKTNEIDREMFNRTFERFKHAPFHLLPPSAQIVAMYANELLNAKSRFKTS